MPQLALEQSFASALEALPADWRTAPVGLAVSGGSDSMALLQLANHWRGMSGATLVVFTVDHRLRSEAAGEAASVGRICARLGLAHHTLVWTKPRPGHAAARRARHALLAAALRAAGGRLLLTGHTADDQAETFLIRLRQGSGWYGLAGMRAVTVSPVWPEGEGVVIARPLLRLRRKELRDWLRVRGDIWFDDPSNEQPIHERVRVRRLLAGAEDRTRRILRVMQGFSMLRQIEDGRLAEWLGERVGVGPAGELLADPFGLPTHSLARGLGHLIQVLAGRETPPRNDALARLAGAVSGAGFRGATLGGVRFRPMRDRLVLTRETGSALPRFAERLALLHQILRFSENPVEMPRRKESFLQDLDPILRNDTVGSDETRHESA